MHSTIDRSIAIRVDADLYECAPLNEICSRSSYAAMYNDQAIVILFAKSRDKAYTTSADNDDGAQYNYIVTHRILAWLVVQLTSRR